jgi:hypothetical protein
MATVSQMLYPENAAFLATAFPAFIRNQGTNFPVTALAYDAAAQENAYWKFSPINYGSGSISAKIFWYADTATTGVVRWDGALAAITDDADTQNVETKAFATTQFVDDTHLGTVGQRLHSIVLPIVNLDSLANGDAAWIRISRLGNNASDTMAGDAFLERVYISYSDV